MAWQHVRMLVKHLPEWEHDIKSVIWHTSHEQEVAMAKKTEVVSSVTYYMHMYSTILH